MESRWSANKNDERIFSASGVAAASRIQPSLDIRGSCMIPLDTKIQGCSSPLYKMA